MKNMLHEVAVSKFGLRSLLLFHTSGFSKKFDGAWNISGDGSQMGGSVSFLFHSTKKHFDGGN